MSYSYAEKRAAIRNAIELIVHWRTKGSPHPSWEGHEAALREVLAEYGQMRLPWEPMDKTRREYAEGDG